LVTVSVSARRVWRRNVPRVRLAECCQWAQQPSIVEPVHLCQRGNVTLIVLNDVGLDKTLEWAVLCHHRQFDIIPQASYAPALLDNP
jgi:hypothetical protein